ncbi:MAG: radical SAM protein [Bacilli bacterium]|nr:radical SAM protein [Bacilli bacterium]
MINYEFDKRRKPYKKINLCIAKHCFLNCPGCYNLFSNSKEISTDEVIRFVEYAKEKELEKVTLSGGDPLSRSDIETIVQKCIDLDLKVNIDTVGLTLLGAKYICGTKKSVPKFKNIELLKKINNLGIPLDGSNNEIVSTFRHYNKEGNLYKEIIKVLDFCEKNKIKICINTVLHKKNIDDITNIFNTIKKYKCVKSWQVFQFMPIGFYAKKNEDKYAVSIEEFDKVKKALENKRTRIEMNFKPAIERAYNYMLIDSNGRAYKVDLANNITEYGNIRDNKTWDNILDNIY